MIDTKLSKVVSYILRHKPEEYGLSLDDDGWIDVLSLLKAIKSRHLEYVEINLEDFIQNFGTPDNKRHEISDGLIRARYGHSVKNKIKKKPTSPPEELFHGTSENALKYIQQEGLKPMDRQYVHLSETTGLAIKVAMRKTKVPIVIKVNALMAFENGVEFYKEDGLWLSQSIPTKFLKPESIP